MPRKKVKRRIRMKTIYEVNFPTWPQDTEIMIREALRLLSDRGGE